MNVDIEVCHIYLKDINIRNSIIELSDIDIKSIERGIQLRDTLENEGHQIRFSILVDDDGSDSTLIKLEDIKNIIERHNITVNQIILESNLATLGMDFISSLKENFITTHSGSIYLNFTTADRFLWAEENISSHKSVKKLFLENIEKNGEKILRTTSKNSRFWIPLKISQNTSHFFTCPLLTCLWYLHRLNIEGFNLNQSIDWEPDLLINVLPSKYLRSESVALELLKLSKFKKIYKVKRKIEYNFI